MNGTESCLLLFFYLNVLFKIKVILLQILLLVPLMQTFISNLFMRQFTETSIHNSLAFRVYTVSLMEISWDQRQAGNQAESRGKLR